MKASYLFAIWILLTMAYMAFFGVPDMFHTIAESTYALFSLFIGMAIGRIRRIN